MMKKFYLILATIWMSLTVFAQTPQHVTQVDDEQVNFWESPTAMIIGGALILILIIARSWSKNIHKKRDDVINDDKKK